MRHLASLLALTLFCLAGTGCALFDKKKDSANAKDSSNSNRSPKQNNDPLLGGHAGSALPPAANPFSADNQASANNPDGILAGRVVDAFDRPQGNADVRWVCMDEKDANGGADVKVNPDGYFVIVGLKKGANYKLIARAKNDGLMMAGIRYASAPDSKMLITINKDFVGADTPPNLGPPAFQPKNDKTTKTSGVHPSFENDWAAFGHTRPADGPGAAAPVNLEPDLPVVMRVPSAPYTAPIPAPPGNQGWTPNPPQGAWAPAVQGPQTWPPPLEIRGPQMKPSAEMQKPLPAIEIQKPVPIPPPRTDDPPPPRFPDPGTSLEAHSAGSARVPSCVLVGGRLQNLALNDINGEPWEFRQHHGKVVLLDFWGTFCQPCRQTMPKLRALHDKFGSKLEIIGIAYEHDGSPQEQAHRVNALCQAMQVSHRQLLGGGLYCPVRTQFRVTALPTLFLLDQDGVILWRYEGAPDRGVMDELERRILRQIN